MLAFEYGITNKSPEFLQKFPSGKIPAFEGREGLMFFEGAAIVRHGTSSSSSGYVEVGAECSCTVIGERLSSRVWSSWSQC
ncbi:hypothetical protein ID866_9244 [Astraeus odoratus]|nr:hypothetical protein ID866_9244 [Astraeus odoratus]